MHIVFAISLLDLNVRKEDEEYHRGSVCDRRSVVLYALS